MTFPTEWKNIKCLKPPTSQWSLKSTSEEFLRSVLQIADVLPNEKNPLKQPQHLSFRPVIFPEEVETSRCPVLLCGSVCPGPWWSLWIPINTGVFHCRATANPYPSVSHGLIQRCHRLSLQQPHSFFGTRKCPLMQPFHLSKNQGHGGWLKSWKAWIWQYVWIHEIHAMCESNCTQSLLHCDNLCFTLRAPGVPCPGRLQTSKDSSRQWVSQVPDEPPDRSLSSARVFSGSSQLEYAGIPAVFLNGGILHPCHPYHPCHPRPVEIGRCFHC